MYSRWLLPVDSRSSSSASVNITYGMVTIEFACLVRKCAKLGKSANKTELFGFISCELGSIIYIGAFVHGLGIDRMFSVPMSQIDFPCNWMVIVLLHLVSRFSFLSWHIHCCGQYAFNNMEGNRNHSRAGIYLVII